MVARELVGVCMGMMAAAAAAAAAAAGMVEIGNED
jgi:hypothetical protein